MTASGHIGDGLSAYLDGELSPAELAAADQHLAGCTPCRDELSATSSTRELVRAAPLVEPPFGFIERLVRQRPLHHRSPVMAMAGVAATATVWLLVLGIAHPTAIVDASSADLPVLQLAASHAVAQQGLGIHRVSALSATSGFTPVAIADVPAAYPVPPSLGDELALVDVRKQGDVVQLVYSGAQGGISVFEQQGSVDFGALPAGDMVTIGHRQAWSGAAGHMQAAVVERAGMAFLVVGDQTASAVLRAAEALPSPGSPSMLDRARRACRGLVRSFSFFG